MNQQQGEALVKAQTTSEPSTQKAQSQPRYLLVSWILLFLLGVLFFLASIFDLLADIRTGLPSDHLEAFHALTGLTWSNAQQSTPQIVHYVTTLEITYAVHEMVFALLFLLIVTFPFRRRARWSWWACWVPMLANLTYTFALAHYSTTTLIYSLIADIALPILLLIHIPAFFRKQ
ncbi:MAG TPA: hypothetical protein VN729_11000 [Ktedonobacteraceae bacterium]|nr:hypothetical protein [Ktedonobacteraceae bacterium]